MQRRANKAFSGRTQKMVTICAFNGQNQLFVPKSGIDKPSSRIK